jgi:hypothetical protein
LQNGDPDSHRDRKNVFLVSNKPRVKTSGNQYLTFPW